MSSAYMQDVGTVEIGARDTLTLRRRIQEQERAAGCVVRYDVPAPRIRTRYHAFVRPDGEVAGCAVIRPRLRGGWAVRFGRAIEVSHYQQTPANNDMEAEQ